MPKLLIVDDDEELLNMLSRTLQGSMFTVHTATNAAEAEKIAKREGVEIVLSDVYLGEPNGLDLLRQLRKSTPHVPVILMTGNLQPALTQSAAEAGAYEILAKPFEPGELILTLTRAARQAERMVQ